MGLAAAYQLVLEGYQPVLFEADDRLGGMTATFDFGGLELERFYHFHCTSDTDFIQLLGELGLAGQLRWKTTRMAYWYREKLQPWGNPLALLRFAGLSPLAKFRYGLHVFLATRRNHWHDLDRQEATAWLKRWVGQEAFEVLWQPLFNFKFYQYAHQLSAAWFWSRIRRLGRSRYNLMKEKLGYLEGGSATLLQALRRAIEAGGGQIRLSTPVQEVVVENHQVKGVRVGGVLEEFDQVISTLPIPYIPQLIPALPAQLRAQYQAVRNIGVVCVIARLNKPVSGNFWLNINDPSMDIPGLVEYSNLRPLNQSVVYAPFYLPTDHPHWAHDHQVFIDKVQSYLRRINPSLSPDDFLELRASRYRFAQPICGPGFAQQLPPIQLPIEGLWVADTSYYYPEDRGISESVGLGRKMARWATGVPS